MNERLERMEQILTDFVTVYLNDKAGRGDEYVEDELKRLNTACEVTSTLLTDCDNYWG